MANKPETLEKFYAPMPRHGWLPGDLKIAIHRDLSTKPEAKKTLLEIGKHFVAIGDLQLAKPAIRAAMETLKKHGAQKALEYLHKETAHVARVTSIMPRKAVPLQKALPAPKPAKPQVKEDFFKRLAPAERTALETHLSKTLVDELRPLRKNTSANEMYTAISILHAMNSSPLIQRSFKAALAAVARHAQTLKTTDEKSIYLRKQTTTLETWAQHCRDRNIPPYALDAIAQAHERKLGSKPHITPEELAAELAKVGCKYEVPREEVQSVLVKPSSIKARRDKHVLIAAVVSELDPRHFEPIPFLLNQKQLEIHPRTEQGKKFLAAIPKQPTWRERLAKKFPGKKK